MVMLMKIEKKPKEKWDIVIITGHYMMGCSCLSLKVNKMNQLINKLKSFAYYDDRSKFSVPYKYKYGLVHK